MTTFGTTGFVVIESDVAGHFESYKARTLAGAWAGGTGYDTE